MSTGNYSFAIPLDQSQWLKVVLIVLDKQSITGNYSSQQNSIITADTPDKDVIELSDVNELPDNIIQAIDTVHAALSSRIPLQYSFMVSTTTGFHLLRLHQIICFEYIPEKKQWTVFLADQTQLSLRRNTISENILSYSPDFVQINKHYIINLQYLIRIEGKLCRLSVHSAHKDKLIISRSFLKGLQERIEVI